MDANKFSHLGAPGSGGHDMGWERDNSPEQSFPNAVTIYMPMFSMQVLLLVLLPL